MWDLARDSTVRLVTELTLLRLQFSFLQGTFNPKIGTATIDSCSPCDAGSFCKQPGLNATEGECFAGYYCTGRSPSPTPVSSYQCVELDAVSSVLICCRFPSENVLSVAETITFYYVSFWKSIVWVMSLLVNIICSTKKLPYLSRWKAALSWR